MPERLTGGLFAVLEQPKVSVMAGDMPRILLLLEVGPGRREDDHAWGLLVEAARVWEQMEEATADREPEEIWWEMPYDPPWPLVRHDDGKVYLPWGDYMTIPVSGLNAATHLLSGLRSLCERYQSEVASATQTFVRDLHDLGEHALIEETIGDDV